MNNNLEVSCCWGDPDDVYYTVEGSDNVRELDFMCHGYVFGIWDDVFIQGSDEDDTATLMHDEFLLYYLYYHGWPKMDIVPIKDINENGWDYNVAKDLQVGYDYYTYYDDEYNVLPEYQMTYGELLNQLGSPRARGRVLVDHNNGWVEFVAFWGEPTLEEKKIVYQHIGNPYVVVFNNIRDAREFYLYEGNKVFTFKEWLESGKYIPRIKKDEEAFALHNMKAKDKWNNTVSFRDLRDKKMADKLGSMTMAQYNSLIHQESIDMDVDVLSEADNSRRLRYMMSTAQMVKWFSKYGYESKFSESAIYTILGKYGIKPKTVRRGKPYFNRKNAIDCLEKHIFELKTLCDNYERQEYGAQNNDDQVGYNRDDMSVASRELLANDGVFGADENELYSNESKKRTVTISENQLNLFDINLKKNIKLNLEQFERLFEGVNVNTGASPISFSINYNSTDAGNSSYGDTRFFGTRGDVAYGDGTNIMGIYGGSFKKQYELTLGMIDLYKSAIRIVQHGWYKNVNALFSKINAPSKSKTDITKVLFDNTISDEEKINRFTGGLNRNINNLNIMQGKYDRINSTIKTGKRGRPKRISDDTVIPRYNIGKVPNTNIKLIGLFEISDFNFSDAIKHGTMRSNEKKGIGNGETINKLGRGRAKARVNLEYDNGITPDVANNFSLNNVGDGHFKQQYGYEDKNYTSVAQFMDKSIMGAAYAIKKEGIQVDYILDAPSSSKFNHYYCTNLSNKLGVEYKSGFFQRNMLNVFIDEDGMRKNGVNERVIQIAKRTVSNAAIAEITSYMTDCVEKFVDENYNYLNNISVVKSSREKIDRNLLISFIRDLSYYGILKIKEAAPKTTNLYMYLVNHFADFKKSIKSTLYNTEHISNEISKILKTKLSRKYQALLLEIDKITSTYENVLLENGMKISSCKKFKATDVDEHVRPYLKNAYVVADSEMAHNKNGIVDKLKASLQNKHFLIVDEDMDSGATLYLLIEALKDKELECGPIERKPGRPKAKIINDDQITCLVNAIKK